MTVAPWLALVMLVVDQVPPPPPPSLSMSSCLVEQRVNVLDHGRFVGSVCAGDAEHDGLTVVALDDDWVPSILADTPYRNVWVALANEHFEVDGVGPRASDDRYLEVWGIMPSLSVLLARLEDRDGYACSDLVDTTALSAMAPGKPNAAATSAVQKLLVCEGLLRTVDVTGKLDGSTSRALAVWQRKEGMVERPGGLDTETTERLLQPRFSRDAMAVLRALRERVADAAGLIEDGSARGEQAPVLGVRLDPPSLRPVRRGPVMRGAPDLIDEGTDQTARALGMSEALFGDGATDDRRAALITMMRGFISLGRIAVRLPSPAWQSRHMASLAASIDRGDVDRSGLTTFGGARPVFRLTTIADDTLFPLVVWPTTIGGTQREKLGTGVVVSKKKASPTGRFAWRFVWAAPVWYPPPSTPDDELVLHTARGPVVNDEGVGPGYRSAYGLVMVQHHEVSVGSDGTARYGDTGVRTHGTGSVRSVLVGGVSHGCHRLLPRSALRLGSYLLRHRQHAAAEDVVEGYSRSLVVGGKRLQLERRIRGTRSELTPPVVVEVPDICPIDDG